MQIWYRSLPNLETDIGFERVDRGHDLAANEDELRAPVEGRRAIHGLVEVELCHHWRRCLVDHVGVESNASSDICSRGKGRSDSSNSLGVGARRYEHIEPMLQEQKSASCLRQLRGGQCSHVG